MLLLAAAKPSLIDINFGLMFWTIVTFLVVLVILKRYAFGPIQEALDARRAAVAADLDAAEKARAEAQEALAEYREQLAASRKEAARIVEDARRAMDEKRRADLAELDLDKQRQLERARSEIAAETRQSLATIKDQVAELTVAATERVLRARLDEDEQRRLIDEALRDVDFAALSPSADLQEDGSLMAERVDPGARVYANALHGAAAEADRVAGVDRDLAELTQALAESRPLRRALFNPELPHAAKHRIVTRLLDQSDELLRNALLVMIDNGRLALLPDLQVAYAELAAEEERILDVDVTTAVPLDKAEVEALEKRVADALGMDARVHARVDPAIIGGLVLQARGVLLDASVRRRLQELRRTLISTPLPIGSEA